MVNYKNIHGQSKENQKYRSQGYSQYHKNKRKRAKRFTKGLATYSG